MIRMTPHRLLGLLRTNRQPARHHASDRSKQGQQTPSRPMPLVLSVACDRQPQKPRCPQRHALKYDDTFTQPLPHGKRHHQKERSNDADTNGGRSHVIIQGPCRFLQWFEVCEHPIESTAPLRDNCGVTGPFSPPRRGAVALEGGTGSNNFGHRADDPERDDVSTLVRSPPAPLRTRHGVTQRPQRKTARSTRPFQIRIRFINR